MQAAELPDFARSANMMLSTDGPNWISRWQDGYATFQLKLQTASLAAFQWQNHASEVLLWMVMAVVSAGVIISLIQILYATFAPGLRKWQNPTHPNSPGPPQADSIELSLKQIRLQTHISGLLMLLISLAFLYLFVHEVYSLQPITDSAVATPMPAASG